MLENKRIAVIDCNSSTYDSFQSSEIISVLDHSTFGKGCYLDPIRSRRASLREWRWRITQEPLTVVSQAFVLLYAFIHLS